MTPRIPPRVATWLVKRLGPHYRRDSLIGDLFEEYQQNRSQTWYWRQAGAAVLLGLRLRLPRFVLSVVLRVLIEMGIVVGGIALAQSNVPQHHLEHLR